MHAEKIARRHHDIRRSSGAPPRIDQLPDGCSHGSRTVRVCGWCSQVAEIMWQAVGAPLDMAIAWRSRAIVCIVPGLEEDQVKSKSVFLVVAALTSSLLGVPAAADVAPPGACECAGHVVGDPCMRRTNGRDFFGSGDPADGGAGVCTSTTCSRFDYAHWDRDAMPLFPPSMKYSCLICDGDASTDTATQPPISGSGSSIGTPSTAQAPSTGGGCSASAAGEGGWLAGLFLIAGSMALFLERRRSR
jgi:hypothetical protein